MCRAGQITEAYDLAKADLELAPNDVWGQRALAWAIYYTIKVDTEQGAFDDMVAHLEEINGLTQLSSANDSLIFDNIQFQIGIFVKEHVFLTDVDANNKLSILFNILRNFESNPSKGHSKLVQSFIKFEGWIELADFIDWWNLENLTTDDYTAYVNPKGQKTMTLAERVFIAHSKALLKQNDLGRVETFLPLLDQLMIDHPEMMYPGYFYGKLLLKLGSDTDEALKVIVPFARKKSGEFWVWQLLSSVFDSDPEKQLACLLRAVHCRTQETFLGKIRIKLADWYIHNQQLDRAKYHIDAFTRCYVSQGWRLPPEVEDWIRSPWIGTVTTNASDPIDYKAITDSVLCNGTDEGIAVVTYVDPNSHRVSMTYGHHLRTSQKLRFKVGPGNVLKINYTKEGNENIRILTANATRFPNDLSYAKVIEGQIVKKQDKNFAFVKFQGGKAFVSPNNVQYYQLTHNETVKALIVQDYDKKKEAWGWICVSIKK